MQLSNNTVLITGGSSGIGLALAQRFLALGNVVIACGRRGQALAEAKRQLPALHTLVADIGNADSRARLFRTATTLFPDLNVLINNAGIQRHVRFVDAEPWSETAREIAVNLEGPLHLSTLFIPHLLAQRRSVLANVSSGLAFVPAAGAPVYSATKAALHSLSMSLRHQLRESAIQVIEIIPPAVRTNLGGFRSSGVALDAYADSVMAQLADGRPEVTYGTSATGSQASRAELDQRFRKLNPR